jgi:hypothetical protein
MKVQSLGSEFKVAANKSEYLNYSSRFSCEVVLCTCYLSLLRITSGAHSEFFSVAGGGAVYPEAIYNLYLILKIML